MSRMRVFTEGERDAIRHQYHVEGVAFSTLRLIHKVGPNHLDQILGVASVGKDTLSTDEVLRKILSRMKAGERCQESHDRRRRIEPNALRHIYRVDNPDVFQLQARSMGMTLTEIVRSVIAAGMEVEGREFRIMERTHLDTADSASSNGQHAKPSEQSAGTITA